MAKILLISITFVLTIIYYNCDASPFKSFQDDPDPEEGAQRNMSVACIAELRPAYFNCLQKTWDISLKSNRTLEMKQAFLHGNLTLAHYLEMKIECCAMLDTIACIDDSLKHFCLAHHYPEMHKFVSEIGQGVTKHLCDVYNCKN